MSELWRDLRWAFRGLTKRPGFAVVAVLTLALGIGATTAIFTVVRGVLLEPLPYPEPDRLVVIQEKNPSAGFPRFAISPLNFRDYREMSTSFEAMAARSGTSLALASEDGSAARNLDGREVTWEYLQVMGFPPELGRDFTPEDDQAGARPVVILSHGLWRDLGGDPSLIGQTLRIEGRAVEVIGVLPADFPRDVDALVPMAIDYEETGRGSHYWIAFGRLEEGVSLETARAELENVAAQLEASYPDSNTGWSALVDPLHERTVEDVETALWILLAAVAFVLLIACANVANLTLVRLASREREMALHSALGAGRWRLLRVQMVESLLLALAAAALGVALAERGTAWLVALNADQIPRSTEIGLDPGVLVFALAAAVGSALLFGLLPALQASKVDLAGTLKEGGRGQAGGRRGQRVRAALVLSEVALALVLLVGAGLLLQSFARLSGVEPGFDLEKVWTANLSLPETAYPEREDRIAFFERFFEEAAALPGVESASAVFPMPLSGNNWINALYIEGEPIPEPNQEHNAHMQFIGPDALETMGLTLVRGRSIERSDHAEAERVILVNESAAKRYWPGEDPLGKRLTFGRPDDEETTWNTVIGVVADAHYTTLDTAPPETVYASMLQAGFSFTTLALSTAGDPASLAGPLRALVAELDRDLALEGEQTGESLLANSVAAPRFNAALLALFAGLALALAAIGIFGVVSYTVAQELRELGVRMALGARARQIVGLVLAKGLRPVAAGIVVGLVSAFAAARLLESLVYGVSVADLGTYALVAGVLAAVAALACLVPALRATRIDPAEILRDE